jgi:hypothetical protein
MTDLVRRIRALTEAEGARRGRPILVAMRVPDSVEYCRAIGLDLERWLADGLFDLFVPAGYFQLNPWEYSVSLGHKHGVRVYPSLDESRVQDPKARALRMTLESYRGRALNAWQAGADGVYLFNSFDPKSQIWREMGSAQALARLDHDYFASIRGQGGAAGGALPHTAFQRVPRLNPRNPVRVTPAQPARVTFQAGDDHPKIAAISLHLQLKNASPATVQVALNGRPLATGEPVDSWLEFGVDPASLKQGSNEVEIRIASDAQPVEWTDMRCSVRMIRAK